MPESAIEQSVQRKPAAQEDTLQRNSGVQQGQLHVLQTKDNVIQPWLDENGKFYPGAQPPNADTDWESFDHGTGKNWQKRWRPKAGSAAAKQAEAVKAAQEDKQQAAKKKAAAKNAEWQKQSRKKDYDSIFLEDPARIRFSQDSISALFSNNQPIQGLVDGLKNGTVQADAIPPLMVWYDEKNKLLFTLDNRRLWAFQKAKKQVRCRFASPEEMKSNQFKFTTKNNGKSIAVRG